MSRRLRRARKRIETTEGADVSKKLEGKRIAFLATDMVEQVELTEPWKAVRDEGAKVELVSLEEGKIQGFNHYDKGDMFGVDRVVEEASASDYDALVIPGGVGNPDTMRTDENAVAFVRDFFEQGKPVGVICHGPWMLVEAGVVRGRKVTSWPSLQTDIRNAGGEWVDKEVVVDQGLVTSRKPDDLPAFNEKIVEEFCEGRHEEQAEKAQNAVHADATPK
ncbi:MAG: type 1 glutamine amidotransferase [Actinobacteria bacterium]|jgi:protease I|nr:MAG: type 1 glutamine amidotransferase [Actinomycetota bacterium]